MEKIISLQNSRIKNLVRLHKAQERKFQGKFLVEGCKEIELATITGHVMDSLFWAPMMGTSIDSVNKLGKNSDKTFEITDEIFAKVAYREKSDGVLAVFNIQSIKLEDIKINENPLVVVLESIEKPGNLGAILRTCDAAAVSAIIICDPKTDIYNPNVVRASVGCLFTNKVVTCTNQEAIVWLQKNKIKTYAAALVEDAEQYDLKNYTEPSAFIMGTEADGLSDFWLKESNEKIIIPMMGKIDSLNVSVSTAILIFEAARQRKFKKLMN